MTREEAIEYLQAIMPESYYEKVREAVQMAIEALKQPEIIRCNECDMFEIVEGCGGICNFFNRSVQVDDFCSYGAKMEGEQ
jgi:hypothetical protein